MKPSAAFTLLLVVLQTNWYITCCTKCKARKTLSNSAQQTLCDTCWILPVWVKFQLTAFNYNHSGQHMEDKRSLITMGLKPMLTDEQLAVRVKMSICQLCIALADHGYVQNEGGGEHVVKFLMYNLITHEDPNAAASNSSTKITRQDPQANAQFHSQCSQALLTISKTCDTAFELLWPYLFEFLCMENYTPVLGDICKCLRILIVRRKESGQAVDIVINTEENRMFLTDWFVKFVCLAKIPGPHQVFARLLVCLNGAALNSTLNRRALNIMSLMKELAGWFCSTLTEVLPERLEKLTKFLEGMF